MIQFLSILLDAKKAKMDQRGASAVEYGLLIAGIAIVIMAAVWLLGPTISNMFNDANSSISNRPNAPVPSGTPSE